MSGVRIEKIETRKPGIKTNGPIQWSTLESSVGVGPFFFCSFFGGRRYLKQNKNTMINKKKS